MGYFKTLTIDPSAAREYSQRWAQKDQVDGGNTYLASDRGSFKNTTTATVASAVLINLVRGVQNDQVEGRIRSHLTSSHEVRYPMTTSTVPGFVNITREHVGRALREWRRNVQHNARDLNAVNRAASNLEACLWYMTPDGELVITSATDSRTRYHVTPGGCDCRAAANGRACWHVAAYKVLHTADAMRRLEASQKATERVMEHVQMLVDELV